MIRRTTHSLKFITDFKKFKIDGFFDEYGRVVNKFIELFWGQQKLLFKVNSVIYRQVDSWLLGKAMKCAGNQAIKIVKSTRKKDRNLTYKKYKRVFAKCKQRDKNLFGILSSKWSIWSKDKVFRHRVKLPIFNGRTIELNSGLVTIQESKTSTSFDLWVRVSSVFGNRFSLILPTKKHKRFNSFISQDFEVKKSITLRKNYKGNYFIDLFLEKETPSKKPQSKCLGIDLGINKLLSLSDGTFIGKELKQILVKLNRKKQGSQRYNRTILEIKHYINLCCKSLDYDNIDVIVMEDLKNITKNTKGRVRKSLRKQLGHWNIDLVYRRINDHCETSRTCQILVDSRYTSQTCSSCQTIDKKARNGEIYKCSKCDLTIDSDYNASLNILHRFLVGGLPSPVTHKKQAI